MIQAHSSVFCFTVGCEFVSPFTPQIKTARSYRLLSLCAAVRVWGSHMNSFNTPSLSVTPITYQLDTQGASEPHFRPAAELTPSLLSTISTILADTVHSIKRTLTYTVGARGWDILSHLFGTNPGVLLVIRPLLFTGDAAGTSVGISRQESMVVGYSQA